MTSNHFNPETKATGSPDLILEIAGQEAKTPMRIPVLIRNLSAGGVTLTVSNPWKILDWDGYRGQDCLLRVEDPKGGAPVDIKASIAWTRSGGTNQPFLSLGLQLINPPGEAISRMSTLLPHASQDIKGLWERYDQVQRMPGNLDWLQYCYIAGLLLLVSGIVLQFAGSPVYKMCGWVLWLLGSLGIAGKIVRPFWEKQTSDDRIGRSL
jgi:hypothetical protein